MKLLVPAYEIIFQDRGHKYFLEGKKLTSVTTIIGIVDKSAPLMYWAAKTAIAYIGKHLDEVRDNLNEEGYKKVFAAAQKSYKEEAAKAADWGTAIHNLIEKANKGEKIDIASQPQQVQLGMTGYFSWAKQVGFKSYYAELSVASKKHNYAGKLDDIGIVRDRLSLVDYKSSNGLYPTYKLQLAAYYQALLETYPNQGFEAIKDFYVIRFGKESGEFEVREIADIKAEIKIFNRCIDIYKWNKVKWV